MSGKRPVKAKFYYTDPTRTGHGQSSRTLSGPCRVRVVEFSYNAAKRPAVPRAYPTPSVASECDPSPARAPSSAAAVDKLSIDGDLSTTETDDARTMHLVCIVAASSRSTPPRLALHAMHAEMRPPIDPSFCSVCFFSICARISPLPVPNDSLPKITVNDTICFFIKVQSAVW